MASSSDEGEIIENGVEDLKATSLRHPEGSGVDRQDRHRSRLSTPDLDSRNTSRRSPSPRGYKRPRDDRARDRDYYPGRTRDYPSRPVRNYDDLRYDDTRRSHAYDDLDRPASRLDYRDGDRSRDRDRDRDWYGNKRPRNRSRSPRRRDDRGKFDRFVREGQYDRYDERNELKYDDDRPRDVSRRSPVGEASRAQKHDAKRDKGIANGHSKAQRYVHFELFDFADQNRVSFVEPEPKPKPEEEDFEEPEPIDEEAEIERRRKRREEILAKSSSATPLLLHAVGAAAKARAESPLSSQADTPAKLHSEMATPRTPRSGTENVDLLPGEANNVVDLASPRSPGSHDELSPGGINLLDDTALMNTHGNAKVVDEDGPSAADYDPTVDMKEDEMRDELRHGHVVLHGEHVTPDQKTKEPQEPTPEKSPEDGGDEDFDMFAEDFDEDRYATKPAATSASNEAGSTPDPMPVQGGILEGDDKDGYYKIRIGEVLNGRYQIQATLGKGMFSGVARAVDITTKKPVAIKMMRNNDALRKGGYTEIAILQKLNEADPDNKKHIVKFERSFDYKGHLCMVFENLSLNLREVLRKFGNNVGINLSATRTYAYQIFVSLAHMRKCSIIHADLKPDNILVSTTMSDMDAANLG